LKIKKYSFENAASLLNFLCLMPMLKPSLEYEENVEKPKNSSKKERKHYGLKTASRLSA
jgi:hypothetical protein